MAISRRSAKNGNVYITYNYRDGKRVINIYCGVEGSERAKAKLGIGQGKAQGTATEKGGRKDDIDVPQCAVPFYILNNESHKPRFYALRLDRGHHDWLVDMQRAIVVSCACRHMTKSGFHIIPLGRSPVTRRPSLSCRRAF